MKMEEFKDYDDNDFEEYFEPSYFDEKEKSLDLLSDENNENLFQNFDDNHTSTPKVKKILVDSVIYGGVNENSELKRNKRLSVTPERLFGEHNLKSILLGSSKEIFIDQVNNSKCSSYSLQDCENSADVMRKFSDNENELELSNFAKHGNMTRSVDLHSKLVNYSFSNSERSGNSSNYFVLSNSLDSSKTSFLETDECTTNANKNDLAIVSNFDDSDRKDEITHDKIFSKEKAKILTPIAINNIVRSQDIEYYNLDDYEDNSSSIDSESDTEDEYYPLLEEKTHDQSISLATVKQRDFSASESSELNEIQNSNILANSLTKTKDASSRSIVHDIEQIPLMPVGQKCKDNSEDEDHHSRVSVTKTDKYKYVHDNTSEKEAPTVKKKHKRTIPNSSDDDSEEEYHPSKDSENDSNSEEEEIVSEEEEKDLRQEEKDLRQEEKDLRQEDNSDNPDNLNECEEVYSDLEDDVLKPWRVGAGTPNTSGTQSHSYNSSNLIPDEYKLPAHELIVPPSSEGGKHYVKNNCCCYCYGLFPRIDRHLEHHHRDKKAVQKILSIAPLSKAAIKKRRYYFGKLRVAGNDRWNSDIRINPNKIMIPTRRLAKNKGKKKKIPNNKVTLTNETTHDISSTHVQSEQTKETAKICKLQLEKVRCNHCARWLSRNYLTQHVIEAHSMNPAAMGTKGAIAAARANMFACHYFAIPKLRKRILAHINEDPIGNIARYDMLIVLYGNKYCIRHSKVDQIDLVKGHMRLLGNLVYTVKTLNPNISSLQDCLRGLHWPHVLKAIKIISEYDEITDKIKIPYNAHTLGMLLRRLFLICKNYYTRTEDNDRLKLLSGFIFAFEDDFTCHVGSRATDAENVARRRRATKPLPISQDVLIFEKFLDNELLKSYQALTQEFTLKQYKRLAVLTVLIIQVFNCRRPCETERAEVEDFRHAHVADPGDEFFQLLTYQDKKQSSTYVRMDCAGKKQNGLDGTAYLKPNIVKAIELLLDCREKASIPAENPFLFAFPNSKEDTRMKHVKASKAMQDLATECHTKYKKLNRPNAITHTGLRKLMATKYALIEKKDEFDSVARHLAHTQKTNLAHYRRPISRDDARMTRTLEILKQPLDAAVETEENLDEGLDQMLDEDEIAIQDNNKNKGEKNIKIGQYATKSNASPNTEESTKIKNQKTRWAPEAIRSFNKHFALALEKGRYASSGEMKIAMSNCSLLAERGEKAIRTRFSNLKLKRKRISEEFEPPKKKKKVPIKSFARTKRGKNDKWL